MPLDKIVTWLGGNSSLSGPEWSFDLENEVKVRSLEFKSADDMRKTLVEKVPLAIHMGAQYKGHVSDRSVVSCPLRFDIDVTDYDPVRFCCVENRTMCSSCWPLMVAAMRIIDDTLRGGFAFTQILWVFSGRRGVHCWVMDERARRLDWEGRRSIAGLFGKEISMHEMDKYYANEWYRLAEPIFQEFIRRQRLFMGPDGYDELLEFVKPDDRSRLLQTHETNLGYDDCAWPVFKESYLKYTGPSLKHWATVLQRVVMKYMSVRLDTEVTKSDTHLLKIPFSIHATTERVCCPLKSDDFKELLNFDPEAVPTLTQILEDEKSMGVFNDYLHLFRQLVPEPRPPPPQSLEW